MAHVALSAQQRTQLGNGPTRRLRREGLVPGIIYQPGGPSLTLAVHARELRRALADGGRTGVIDLTLADDKTRPVLVKDWQLDPVRGDVTHIDFQEVDLKQEVTTTVALTLVGTPVGVREGGVLDQTMREVEVSALPDSLPDQIELDVSELDVNSSVSVADLTAPAGVTIVSDPGTVIASVVAPMAAEPVEGEGEAEVEGETEGEAGE
ncbi:MAG: 50S ribosomal protein L25 [Thermoleophilia bacterium]|jgi:large subunit ribosomal protein L25